MRIGLFKTMVTGALVVTAASCARSPTGTPQLRLVSDAEMSKLGVTAFQEMKAETPETTNETLKRYVLCVAEAVTRDAAPDVKWEVRVFESPDINAFALPGGKIGVYTGILEVADTQDQLAAILGHEVAHVTAHHSNARVSAALATNAGLQLGQLAAGRSTAAKRAAFGLLGVGAQYGALMPYGRGQETEADVLGLEYMARAGFDPRAAVTLWRNMAVATRGKGQPPTFLSTHPSHEGRIEDLEKHMAEALIVADAARRGGKNPSCAVARTASAAR